MKGLAALIRSASCLALLVSLESGASAQDQRVARATTPSPNDFEQFAMNVTACLDKGDAACLGRFVKAGDRFVVDGREFNPCPNFESGGQFFSTRRDLIACFLNQRKDSLRSCLASPWARRKAVAGRTFSVCDPEICEIARTPQGWRLGPISVAGEDGDLCPQVNGERR